MIAPRSFVGIQGATGPSGPAGPGKRTETYAGVTDASGLFTVSFGVAFPSTPILQPEPTGNPSQFWQKVSASASGFSVRLVQRASLNVLGLDVLASAVTNVAGASVKVAVIEP